MAEIEKGNQMNYKTEKKIHPKSGIRNIYIAKLAGRILILCLCGYIYVSDQSQFDILHGMNFFSSISIFHILWGIWMIDMFWQVVPVKNRIALGSQKLFRMRFRPIREKINKQSLKDYIVSTTKSAYLVFVLWTALIAVMGVLYQKQMIDDTFLFMSAVVFYVCDLICVLIWCPFRLIMRNRCCTTCRIFNWDHLMMFSPFVYVGGFYAGSLLAVSVLAWLIWELAVLVYPERFWEYSNDALKCTNCTDQLCTQYCKKLR